MDGHSKNPDFGVDSYCQNKALLYLQPYVNYRVQLGLERSKVLVAVNGKLACSNIPREDRKVFNNTMVYLGDPWYPAARATVTNLYLREGKSSVLCTV